MYSILRRLGINQNKSLSLKFQIKIKKIDQNRFPKTRISQLVYLTKFTKMNRLGFTPKLLKSINTGRKNPFSFRTFSAWSPLPLMMIRYSSNFRITRIKRFWFKAMDSEYPLKTKKINKRKIFLIFDN